MALIDPINNFEIPEEWIARADMAREDLVQGVLKGLFVVLSSGDVLKRGYSTGTTAAAAAKASVMSLIEPVDTVSVPTPSGIRAQLAVKARDGRSEVVKISGDHASDATRGLVIAAEAIASAMISLSAGEGIGTVTRPGLQVPVGQPAINPAPQRQIIEAIQEALDITGLDGAAVTISAPGGKKASAATLNAALGITGGISILGTTGFVEPWDDHLDRTKMELIGNAHNVVLTTGRIGMRYARMLFPGHTVVLVGSRLDEAIEAARGESIICGLPGLILRWAVPDMLKGTEFCTVQEMIDRDRENSIIDEALITAVKKSRGSRIVLVDRAGIIIRDTEGKS